jgi:uncharacterized glyoxalase superfamily protein PhnB
MHPVHFILYVSSQETATAFYSTILDKTPVLNIPGMTEFRLNDSCKLGLMPNTGITKILGHALPHPETGSGIPRCELYLYVDDVETAFARATQHGAKVVSPPEDRNWGDRTCYLADADGHITAFAEKL